MRRWFKGYRRGGFVTGPRVGDDVPAMLSGERLVASNWEVTIPSQIERYHGAKQMTVILCANTPAEIVDAFNDMAKAVGWRVRADEGVVE